MGEIFGLALGIALSPFPVVPAVLLLFTARPRPTSLAFLGTWIVAIGTATGTFVMLSDAVASTGSSPRWLDWLRLVGGLLLVAYGVASWRSRHASDEPPGWMQSIQDATPRKAARLALLLSVANPKVVLLAAAAGLTIGVRGSTVLGETVAVVGFTAVASMSVGVPVLLYAVAGERVLPPLARARDWLLRNSAAVMALVITAIGLLLIKSGATGL